MSQATPSHQRIGRYLVAPTLPQHIRDELHASVQNIKMPWATRWAQHLTAPLLLGVSGGLLVTSLFAEVTPIPQISGTVAAVLFVYLLWVAFAEHKEGRGPHAPNPATLAAYSDEIVDIQQLPLREAARLRAIAVDAQFVTQHDADDLEVAALAQHALWEAARRTSVAQQLDTQIAAMQHQQAHSPVPDKGPMREATRMRDQLNREVDLISHELTMVVEDIRRESETRDLNRLIEAARPLTQEQWRIR